MCNIIMMLHFINGYILYLSFQACIPHLLETKGNIVNVSSVTGLRAFPGVVAYNMSKVLMNIKNTAR